MREAKFQVGDRVVAGNNRISCEVMDCLYSARSDEWLYELRADGEDIGTYAERYLDVAPVKKEYRIDMEIADNVVICKLIDVAYGDEISRGFRHFGKGNFSLLLQGYCPLFHSAGIEIFIVLHHIPAA